MVVRYPTSSQKLNKAEQKNRPKLVEGQFSASDFFVNCGFSVKKF